jgi:hypothetical protein
MTFSNRWAKAFAMGLALLVAGTGMAYAQLQTGNLYGTVMDEQGSRLPGVTVTLSGRGAQQVQVTNTQGEFRFLSLAPGAYQLSAGLEGFSTVEYPNVSINVGRNTSLELTLSSAVEDVITVTSESPLLDERKISTGTTVSQTELEKIPTARDPWVILQQTPGVLVDRINVGGNESGQQSQYISPGTSANNSQWAVDGVTITDMGAIGSSPTYYNFDSFEEMQVSTGGSDTGSSTAGVILNMVTKRGTNEWRASARYLLTDDTIDQADVKFSDLGVGQDPAKVGQGNQIVDVIDYGIEGGGPIVKDRLWVWGSYGTQEADLRTINGDPDFTELDSYAIKINGQLASNNSLTAFYHYGDKIKIGRNAGPTRAAPTTWNQDGPTDIWKLEDTHIFNSNFYLTGMASYVGGGFQLAPQGGGIGAHSDPTKNAVQDRGGVWQNSFLLYQTDRPQEQLKVDGNYFFNTGSISHELRFGVGRREAEVTSYSNWPGQQAVGLQGLFGGNVGLAFVRTERRVGDQIDYTTVHLQDTLSVGNLTANLGLRYDLQEPTMLAATVAPAQGLLLGGSFGGGDPGFEWESITPRLGLTYALGQQRKTLLRASYSQFADQMGTGTASFVNPANYAYGYAVWYDNGDGILTPNEIGDFFSFYGSIDPSNPGQLISANRVDRNLDPPTTHEVVLGVEHALRPEFVIGLSTTIRRYTDILETERLVCDGECAPFFVNARPHRASDYRVGFVHRGRLPDGSTFESPQYTLVPGVVYSGGNLLTNGDREQNYIGTSLTFNKRLANRWLLRGHFTWQDWEWDVPSSELEDPTHTLPGANDGDSVLSPSGTTSGAKGGIFINSNWSFDVSGMYQIAPDRPWGFNLAANLNGREGYPIPYVSRRNLSDGFGTRQVLAAGNEDFRNPDVYIFNARVEKEVAMGDVGVTFSVDAFNLFNENYVLQRDVRLPLCSAGYSGRDAIAGTSPNSLGGPCSAGVANGNTANPTGNGRGDFVNEVVSPRIFRLGVRLSFR